VKIEFHVMHPSTSLSNSELTVPSTAMVSNHASNYVSSTTNANPFQTLNNGNGTNHYAFPHIGSTSSNYMDIFRTWNYHRYISTPMKTDSTSDNSSIDCHSRNGSFHRYSPCLGQKAIYPIDDDDLLLNKFCHDTLVNLDTGESKNIQNLTSNDFILSAKKNPHYSR
jgi:hypothetical protein